MRRERYFSRGLGQPLSVVGIIANPSASKDIRRLVAQGRVVPDWEKVNILRRVLLGLQAVGVAQVVAMPDSSQLCQRAAADAQLSLNLALLDMPAYYTEGDTIRGGGLDERPGRHLPDYPGRRWH